MIYSSPPLPKFYYSPNQNQKRDGSTVSVGPSLGGVQDESSRPVTPFSLDGTSLTPSSSFRSSPFGLEDFSETSLSPFSVDMMDGSSSDASSVGARDHVSPRLQAMLQEPRSWKALKEPIGKLKPFEPNTDVFLDLEPERSQVQTAPPGERATRPYHANHLNKALVSKPQLELFLATASWSLKLGTGGILYAVSHSVGSQGAPQRYSKAGRQYLQTNAIFGSNKLRLFALPLAVLQEAIGDVKAESATWSTQAAIDSWAVLQRRGVRRGVKPHLASSPLA